MLLKAMTVFFRSGEKILETIPQIGIERKNIGEVISNFTIIIEKLFSYQEYFIWIFRWFIFINGIIRRNYKSILADELGDLNPIISQDNTMFKKGDFEGFKILIGMFWSCVLDKEESEWVDKKYLLERYVKEKECLKEVLEYYSIEIVIKKKIIKNVLKN